MKKPRFEETLKRLEEIVGRLEDGDLSIDESLKLFEEGVKLSRQCNRILEDAERRIEVLVKDENGTKKVKPFIPVDAGEDGS